MARIEERLVPLGGVEAVDSGRAIIRLTLSPAAFSVLNDRLENNSGPARGPEF